MKRSRILLITALVALLAGGWYVAKRGGETTLIGRLLDVANKGGIKSLDGAKLQGNATQSGNPLEDVAGLAIKGINLFQGNTTPLTTTCATVEASFTSSIWTL